MAEIKVRLVDEDQFRIVWKGDNYNWKWFALPMSDLSKLVEALQEFQKEPATGYEEGD